MLNSELRKKSKLSRKVRENKQINNKYLQLEFWSLLEIRACAVRTNILCIIFLDASPSVCSYKTVMDMITCQKVRIAIWIKTHFVPPTDWRWPESKVCWRRVFVWRFIFHVSLWSWDTPREEEATAPHVPGQSKIYLAQKTNDPFIVWWLILLSGMITDYKYLSDASIPAR